MTQTSVQDKSPIELVHALIRDSRKAHIYREEIERRIGKDLLDISLDDIVKLLSPSSVQDQVTSFPYPMFHQDRSFRPFPREDFSVPGACVIAEAILSTSWEGCFTKTQTPPDSLKTLRRIVDAKLITQDDFDSPSHANLFRVIVGEFNKWASKNLK